MPADHAGPAAAAQGVAAVLSKGSSHASLQAVKSQVEKELAQERARAEEYLRQPHRGGGGPAIEAVQARLESLMALQAVLRAFLRRNQDTVAYLSSTATAQLSDQPPASADGGDAGNDPAAPLQGQGRAFQALLAEAEALSWAYLALGFLHALERSTTQGPLDRAHAIGPVSLPLASAQQAWDFELVREEVLAEVFGVDPGREDLLQAGQQPLEGWLGPWWANVLPDQGGLRLAEAPFLPWRVLGARLQAGQPVERAVVAAKRARLLTLYAAADAWARELGGQGSLAVAALRHGLAGPFAAQVGVPLEEALACLAHWSADQRGGEGADELALAANLPSSGTGTGAASTSYRRLLWALAAHHRFAEAAHLLDAAPAASPTPLDGCLAVGVLMGLGQWQQAFVRQRLLSAVPRGPLARLPISRRLAPLRLLAHRLVEEHRVGWLTALPFNPLEAQHVVATLYQSPLRTRDHALLALLLRRKEFTRAWAAWAVLGPDIPDDRGEAQAAKEDLARLVQAVERFIPQEELGAMRRARDALAGGTGNAEDSALLERFANLAPLEEGEGEQMEGEPATDAAAMARERQQRRRVLMERERARAPLRGVRTGASAAPLPGRVGVGAGAGGAGAFSLAAAAALESPMKRGASDGGGGSSSGGDASGRGLRARGSTGGASGSGSAGGAGRLRSPPVALRPGWSSRRDRFGAAAAGGAVAPGSARGGGDGYSRMEEELI